MTEKRTLFKNLACLSFSLFTFFMASIFVSQTYFNRIINDQIQELAFLKSVHYQDWGKLSAPSPVIHKFQPYVYDQSGNSTLYSQSLKYQYTFSYDNFSFTQGNTGNIRYLNNWKRELIPAENQLNLDGTKINVFNVEAQKVFNYDYYAPDIRRFALTYNIVFDMLVKEFLPEFYALYIYEYMFKNLTLVQTRVFDPVGISKEAGGKIYTHEKLGLDSAEKIARWIKLGSQVDDNTIYTSETYRQSIDYLNLTSKQIMYIAGPQSTIQGLLHAVKGIITAKLNDIDSDYCSDDLDDDGFCTGDKIIAAQLGVGVLTSQQLFPTVIINQAISQLNKTMLNTIEYRVFCDQRTDLKNCSGDDNTDAMGFFGKKYLANYSEVAYIFKNLDKPQAIEETYDIKYAGQAMIEYIKFLFSKSLNLNLQKGEQRTGYDGKQKNLQDIQQRKQAKAQQKSQKFKPITQINSYSSLQDDDLKVQVFKRSFTNYNHIQPAIDRFRSLLNVQLYSRAYFNKLISTTKPKCEDYYTGDFQPNKDDCQTLPLNTLDDIRVYMVVFLGGVSEKFTNMSTIQGPMLYQFFHNPQKSLFAQQTHQLAADLAAQFNCSSNKFCSIDELFYQEWKSGFVLKNLPSPKYFPQKQDTITNWDQQNTLKGTQPQLFNFLNVTDQVNPQQILNSKTGIYSLFNLMKLYNDRNGSTFTGISNSDLLSYLQTIVIQVEFEGIDREQSFTQFFNTHKSQIIDYKRQMKPQLGGAPWLSPNISVLKLENQPQRFNYINSGIYNSQKLRSLSMIEDNLYSSSMYQVFQSEWQDVSVTFTNANKIKGTNLFGFQTKIQEHDSIEGYFDMIYQAQVLNYEESLEWINPEGKKINAFRFALGGAKTFNITVEQLTNKVVQLKADTYFIVQPNTGLTLQMYIKYTVYSRPFYAQLMCKSQLFPLYQGEIYYVNGNTDPVVQISSDQHTLKVLLILGIVFSSLFLVVFVIMLIMFKRRRRGDKFKEENKSLLSGDAASGAGSTLE